MSSRDTYTPSPVGAAEVQKDGDKWTLVLVRELQHPPAAVWAALTDPAQLSEWAPFDADRSLGSVGTVKLTTIGSPQPHVTDTQVKRADAPRLLEYNWGGQEIRWELEPLGGTGTRLKLWHLIDRRYIVWGAAGWHLCFDSLDRFLAGDPVGRMVGPDAMKLSAWPQLTSAYAKQLGVDAPPSW